MSDVVYIFQHIEKTAGSTLNKLLVRLLPAPRAMFVDPYFDPGHPDAVAWTDQYTESNLQAVKVLFGHHFYGAHELVPDRPTRYFSFVRDPLDHLLSMYHYASTRPGHRLFERTQDGFQRFIEHLETEDSLRLYLCNPQSQALSRSVVKDEVLATLEEHYCFLAPVENFDHVLPHLMREHLGLPLDELPPRQNVSQKKLTRDEVSTRVRKKIYESNHVDRFIHQGSLGLGATDWRPLRRMFERG